MFWKLRQVHLSRLEFYLSSWNKDFCTAATTAFRNTAIFHSNSAQSPTDATFLSEEDLYSRAHCIPVLPFRGDLAELSVRSPRKLIIFII